MCNTPPLELTLPVMLGKATHEACPKDVPLWVAGHQPPALHPTIKHGLKGRPVTPGRVEVFKKEDDTEGSASVLFSCSPLVIPV